MENSRRRRVRASQEQATKSVSAEVSRSGQSVESGIITDETHQIPNNATPDSSRISYKLGVTKNLGDFESLRLEVSFDMPTSAVTEEELIEEKNRIGDLVISSMEDELAVVTPKARELLAR